jgi:hypothetical protein
MCDQGFDPSTRSLLPATRAESENEIRGIGLLKEAPEDIPRRNDKVITLGVIPVDARQSDEAALPTTRDRECGHKSLTVELLVVILAGDLPPTLPVHLRLDYP